MNPQRRGGLAALTLAALALAGCASARVGSYLPRGTDVTRYQTYDWAPAERFATGDPRLDNNPFFQAQVQASVERQLTSRGFRKNTSGTPELLIHYRARVAQRIDRVTTYDEYGACRDCEAYLSDAGTLVIDFVDARTHQPVWGGWAEKSFDGAIDDQDRMDETIERAVASILEKFPR
jgi:hypothetical protein